MTYPLATSMVSGLMPAARAELQDLDHATLVQALTDILARMPTAGGTFGGLVAVTEMAGTWAATLTPDINPATGKQCFSYPVNGNCTLAALAGTASLAANTVVSGSIYLTFSGSYTVTLASGYKPPAGVASSIAGVSGEVWRVDFQYRRTANRCSASVVRETT